MADEPKAPRKRAVKKAVPAVTSQENTEAPAEKKTRKKAVPAVVASPIFQAAPTPEAKSEAKVDKPLSKGKKGNKPAKKEKAQENKDSVSSNEKHDDEDSRRGGRRRRRGGRGQIGRAHV